MLKWSNADVFLHYNISDFQHQRYQVLEDESAAVLYGLNRNTDKIFTIWKAGSGKEDNHITGVTRYPEDVQNFLFLKHITQDDPYGEYLKIVYYSQGDEYYSASTGNLEKQNRHYRSEDAESGTLYTNNFFLRKNVSDKIDICKYDGTLLKQISASGILLDACESYDSSILFISLRESEKAAYCVILDSNLELLARKQGNYIMLQNGRLYRDDGTGCIFQGVVCSRTMLRDRIMELEDRRR